jgi:hypothetical protein
MLVYGRIALGYLGSVLRILLRLASDVCGPKVLVHVGTAKFQALRMLNEPILGMGADLNPATPADATARQEYLGAPALGHGRARGWSEVLDHAATLS